MKLNIKDAVSKSLLGAGGGIGFSIVSKILPSTMTDKTKGVLGILASGAIVAFMPKSDFAAAFAAGMSGVAGQKLMTSLGFQVGEFETAAAVPNQQLEANLALELQRMDNQLAQFETVNGYESEVSDILSVAESDFAAM